MLAELSELHPSIKAAFEEASDGAGVDLWALSQAGPEEMLGRTEYTQPALLAAGIAVWRLWQQQGGATPAEAMGLTLSTAIQYANDCLARGWDPDYFLPRFTFFFDISISFFEEVAKFRAGRRLWARLTRDQLPPRQLTPDGPPPPRNWPACAPCCARPTRHWAPGKSRPSCAAPPATWSPGMRIRRATPTVAAYQPASAKTVPPAPASSTRPPRFASSAENP